MKKKFLALLLGGVTAVGALSMQVPVTVEAMTLEECGWHTASHIESYEVTTVDGQLAVKIDVKGFEGDVTAEQAGFSLFAIEKQLGDTIKWGLISEELHALGYPEGACLYANTASGTYTFTGLTAGKTYYVYCVVFDHDWGPESMDNHDVICLGSGTPTGNNPATVKFDECEDSTSHIRSSKIATVDGKLTVTIDIAFETVNGQFNLYVFDKKLEKRHVGFFEFYDTQWGETASAELEALKEGGTYTFDGLAGDKTYYVYCNVEDNHEINGWGEGEDPNDIFWHYAAYLGANGSGSGSSDNSSSNSTPSNSTPSDNASSGSSNETTGISYEETVADRIQAAQPGSTVVMEKGVTTLSNAAMKELLAKGNVSLKMEFTYKDKEYVILIPAGSAIDNDIPWYGPLYLAQHFGNRAGTTASSASGTGNTYEVRSGDCLSKIAAANRMTLKQLLEKNPQIKDPNKIVVGQKINR